MFVIFNIRRISAIFLSICVLMTAGGVFYVRSRAEDGVQLPILMYHSVLKDTSRTGKYIITPDRIESDLQYLAERGYKSVSASDVIAYATNDGKLPEKPYLITFDDGCYNNLTYVLPLLEKYDAYAVISVVGSYCEEFSENGEANAAYSYLRWEDITELNNTGRIEFGNHSYDMHSITSARIGSKIARGEDKWTYIDKFSRDCGKTQQLLADNCGITPVVYAYPFGAYCEESHNVLDEKGFVMTLTCTEGINELKRSADCLYLMKRFNRPGTLMTETFFEKCGIK